MTKSLPDPAWSDGAELCIGCGYSLRGLPAPGRCPECGVEFGQSQLILHGVPNRNTGMKPGRRIGWVAAITLWVVLSIFWSLLLILSWIALLICLLVGTGLLIWLLTTGPRERRGVERFVLSPGGIARVPMVLDKDKNQLDTIFTPWSSAATFQLQRISPVWYRLRIMPPGGGKPIFDAGIRCPDASAGEIRATIGGYLPNSSTANAPPTSVPRAAATGSSLGSAPHPPRIEPPASNTTP